MLEHGRTVRLDMLFVQESLTTATFTFSISCAMSRDDVWMRLPASCDRNVGYGDRSVARVVGSNMSRVIAVVACGLSVAACSVMPNLNFFKRSETTEALRFESAPPGAEVKTSSRQNCLTPCELTVQANTEFTATFTLKPYKPQTIAIRPEMAPGADAPRLSPNPVYAEFNPPKAKQARCLGQARGHQGQQTLPRHR
jgi:hypothetical protein